MRMYFQNKVVSMMNKVTSVLRRENGQGMVEYALLIGLIAVLLIGGLVVMKDSIAAKFTQIVTALK